jgi:hypothetical protein
VRWRWLAWAGAFSLSLPLSSSSLLLLPSLPSSSLLLLTSSSEVRQMPKPTVCMASKTAAVCCGTQRAGVSDTGLEAGKVRPAA